VPVLNFLFADEFGAELHARTAARYETAFMPRSLAPPSREVGQVEVAADLIERELCVVDAEQVQHRRALFVDVDLTFDYSISHATSGCGSRSWTCPHRHLS